MARKSKVKEEPALVDERQKKLENLTLAIWGIGGVFIVLGMFVLSAFLSQGVDAAKGKLFIAFCVFGGLFGIAILVRWLLGRKA